MQTARKRKIFKNLFFMSIKDFVCIKYVGKDNHCKAYIVGTFFRNYLHKSSEKKGMPCFSRFNRINEPVVLRKKGHANRRTALIPEGRFLLFLTLTSPAATAQASEVSVIQTRDRHANPSHKKFIFFVTSVMLSRIGT